MMCKFLYFSLIILITTNIINAQQYDSVFINCPNTYDLYKNFPVEIELYKNGKLSYIDTEIDLNYADGEINTIKVRKGKGSTQININEDQNSTISIKGSTFSKTLYCNQSAIIELYDSLQNNLILEENKSYYISSDLIVPSSYKLTIGAGSRISIKENVNIIVDGIIQSDGGLNNPIIFDCNSPNKFWGGIIIKNDIDTSIFRHTFIINGGNDSQFSFGHSNSQPILFAENSNLILDRCYFMDNIGKAIGSLKSNLLIKNCFISRCDTGGEFLTSKVEADSCHIMFIPDEDGILEDDDNDGWYFNDVHPSGVESFVKNTYIISTEDDGIDQNKAKLRVENCWMEDCEHEGIACSNNNYVKINNCVFMNCGQGVENGYGKASVEVDHCLFLNNKVGVRFGDEYDILSEGKMYVTNSVFFNNDDNILNFDPQIGGPIDNSLFVSYSLTNTIDYDNINNCISGIPLFNSDYILVASSPGYLAGNDGYSMGLINSITTIPQIALNNIFN
ncbi:MAG: right-handed parallel beta-helix repeat-containing protein, partial [Bacteroidales bacterium]|nr:right-handed parallel beta-helix repeat-containing protein [Bacteroidales bacterium]